MVSDDYGHCFLVEADLLARGSSITAPTCGAILAPQVCYRHYVFFPWHYLICVFSFLLSDGIRRLWTLFFGRSRSSCEGLVYHRPNLWCHFGTSSLLQALCLFSLALSYLCFLCLFLRFSLFSLSVPIRGRRVSRATEKTHLLKHVFLFHGVNLMTVLYKTGAKI